MLYNFGWERLAREYASFIMTGGLSEVIPVHRVVGSHLRVVEVLLPPDVNMQIASSHLGVVGPNYPQM